MKGKKKTEKRKLLKAHLNFSLLFLGGTYETRNGMKEPDHFGETVSKVCYQSCLRTFSLVSRSI